MFSKDLVNNKVNGLSYYLYHDFEPLHPEDEEVQGIDLKGPMGIQGISEDDNI